MDERQTRIRESDPFAGAMRPYLLISISLPIETS